MTIYMNTDGSAAGNPGPGGVGVVLRTPPEEEGGMEILLKECGEYIGRATNNQAEYRALIRGMELALAEGATDLHARCDSLVVVKQFLGEWKINEPALIVLRRQAVDLSKRFASFTIQHIYGVHNLEADLLAKKAARRGR